MPDTCSRKWIRPHMPRCTFVGVRGIRRLRPSVASSSILTTIKGKGSRYPIRCLIHIGTRSYRPSRASQAVISISYTQAALHPGTTLCCISGIIVKYQPPNLDSNPCIDSSRRKRESCISCCAIDIMRHSKGPQRRSPVSIASTLPTRRDAKLRRAPAVVSSLEACKVGC